MAEYIDRDDALDALQGRIKLSDECLPFFKEYLQGVNDRIKAIPSADFVERKHGKWTLFENDIEQNAYECSVCKDVFVLLEGTPQDNIYNFCPNCGADMRESEGEE